MKALAEIKTHDPQDTCSAGYTFTLWDDGHISAEYYTRWQGSWTGSRYVTGAGFVDLSRLDSGNPDSDAEALLTMATRDVEPRYDWVQTKQGYRVT